MREATVVGSGPSGIHFALALLERGIGVRMLDAGLEGDAPVEPDLDLAALRDSLSDPVRYFLGEDLYGLSLPGAEGEFYGFPPQKSFVFERPPGLTERADGFEPLSSWARGGLARTWTAGVYPFNDAELSEFPFDWEAIEPCYAEVASRIGVTGAIDDLTPFMPWHDGLTDPLELDSQSRSLLARYERARDRVRGRYGAHIGRSRLAVLSGARGERGACEYLGRCLWGCPVGALYTPDLTLEDCRRYANFTYEPGTLVLSFGFGEDRRVRTVRTRPFDGGPVEDRPVEALGLAAGTVATARIFLASWLEGTGERPRLTGLMDNRQVLVPFVHWPHIGRRYDERSYQYHQLSLGLEGETPEAYVHGQVTTLTTAQAHPILHAMPLDLATSGFVFRNVRGALGLVNVNFHDTRRAGCWVGLEETDAEGGERRLRIRYEPPADEGARIRAALRRVKKALRALRCAVPPGTIHVRPMGASVHYAGTIPMTGEERPFTLRPDGSSRDFENLFVVDGSGFPFLPAKNLTFTLMANARRVAREAF